MSPGPRSLAHDARHRLAAAAMALCRRRALPAVLTCLWVAVAPCFAGLASVAVAASSAPTQGASPDAKPVSPAPGAAPEAAKAPAAQIPSLADDRALRQAIADAFWWGDYPELLRHYRTVSAPGAVNATGVRTRFLVFHDGIDQVLDDRRSTAAALRLMAQRLGELSAAEPAEPLWPGLHAQLLVAQAWELRGGGYANTVPPSAWAEFEALLRQAAEQLARGGETALQSPLAHLAMLKIARGLGATTSRMEALLDDGLRRHPWADWLIVVAMDHVLPKWGGDARAVARFISREAERMAYLSPDEGYAVLYSSAARSQFEHRLFEDSRAHWPRMRSGYQSILGRHDTPGMRQRAAYFACTARDRDAYLEFAATGQEPFVASSWGNKPQVTADGCARWATSQ